MSATATLQKSKPPVISIVIPSLNQAEYLEQTIVSILDQGYAALQLMIIDGASTDGSVDIIKRYAKWLDYWVSEPDKGQSDAINKGFRKANGEIINWLNSDDQLAESSLLEISRVWNEFEPHILTGRASVINQSSGEEICAVGANPPRCITDFYLRPDRIFCQPSTFVAKALYDEIGELRRDLHYVFDWEWYLRARIQLKNRLRIATTNRLISYIRAHDKTKTALGPHNFLAEGKRILRETEFELSNKEKAVLQKHQKRYKNKKMIRRLSLENRSDLMTLVACSARRPSLLKYKLYWHALKRALN